MNNAKGSIRKGTKGSTKGAARKVWLDGDVRWEYLQGCCGVRELMNLENHDSYYSCSQRDEAIGRITSKEKLDARVNWLLSEDVHSGNVVFTDAAPYTGGNMWASTFRSIGWKVRTIQLNRNPNSGNELKMWIATSK